MNIERLWLFSMMTIVVLITMSPAHVCRADDRARDRKTLKGIQSVVVKVHAIEADWQAESVGMRRLALIQDGIKSLVDVFIEADTSENPDSARR
jgi:hypothetical protein